VTWRTVQSNPDYRAIYDLLKTGAKTFKQLRAGLVSTVTGTAPGTPRGVLPGTLLKRLKKLDRACLVKFERRGTVLKRWEEAGLYVPDPPGAGRPSEGVWWADSSDSAAVQVAVAHADVLGDTPREQLTLERIGNGTDVLASRTTGDTARWWYPKSFRGDLGMLFNVADRVAREIGRTLLAENPEALAAQRRLRRTVLRYRSTADRAKQPVRSIPQIEAALKEAEKFEFLLSIRVLPADWWEGEPGIPIALESKAGVTLVRIHEMTRPPSMPIHALSPELAKEFAKQEAAADPDGVTILAATRVRKQRSERKGSRSSS
jgi:hypothetical protein